MSATDIYRLTKPTDWAGVPTSFSYSSLTNIERCPFQWQLINSKYGVFSRFPSRPHPAAAEGDIVHQVLDDLFRTLALNGLPAFGTPEFRQCVTAVDVRGSVAKLVLEHERLIAEHPRGGSRRLRAGVQQLANQVIRLFRTQYAQTTPGGFSRVASSQHLYKTAGVPSGKALFDLLAGRGALSELPLSHPQLPFSGIVDLIRLDGGEIVIVDFKTGVRREEHRKQVTLYAVLWWRCSGTSVRRCQVSYPSEVQIIELTERDLISAEKSLTKRINEAQATLSSPSAKAVTGDHCTFCDVRQFCQAYWSKRALPAKRKSAISENQTIDIELVVSSEPSPNGFEAKAINGSVFTVVFQQTEVKMHGPFQLGERLRVLRGALGGQNGEIQLKNWTEVFHCGSAH